MVALNIDRGLSPGGMDDIFAECCAMADAIDLSPELQEDFTVDALFNKWSHLRLATSIHMTRQSSCSVSSSPTDQQLQRSDG